MWTMGHMTAEENAIEKSTEKRNNGIELLCDPWLHCLFAQRARTGQSVSNQNESFSPWLGLQWTIAG